MGLLDDLKQQAEMVKRQQFSRKAMLADSIKLVEARMQQTFLYLDDLLKQLAVLDPTNPTVYSIPGVGDLQNLRYADLGGCPEGLDPACGESPLGGIPSI